MLEPYSIRFDKEGNCHLGMASIPKAKAVARSAKTPEQKRAAKRYLELSRAWILDQWNKADKWDAVMLGQLYAIEDMLIDERNG